MTRGRLPGGGGSSVVGKRETRLYEPEERLHSSSRGVKTGAFCSASKNASESISFPSEWSAYAPLERGASKRTRSSILRSLNS